LILFKRFVAKRLNSVAIASLMVNKLWRWCRLKTHVH